MINKYLVHFAGIICGGTFIFIGQLIASMMIKFSQSAINSLLLSETNPPVLVGSGSLQQPQMDFSYFEKIESFASVARNAEYVNLSISAFGLLILIYFSSSLFIEVLKDIKQIKSVKSQKDIKDTSE